MKKLTVKKVLLFVAFIAAVKLFTVIGWEWVGEDFVNGLFPENTVAVEREAVEVTDFELFVASPEVQTELELMFKKHQLQELEAEIKELSKQ